jgi:hypothetical protein
VHIVTSQGVIGGLLKRSAPITQLQFHGVIGPVRIDRNEVYASIHQRDLGVDFPASGDEDLRNAPS